ncbi:MAG: ABC transporter ATP-binding protein [Desulfurococcales archaeon]|nr:ABC transporter ATP-binding protein [Desulfurococcales archaeon]
MASVRLEGIVKRFGSTVALRGVDLEIEDGESMVLLGPSGCGKTTTLRIVAGLEKPTMGRVYFNDRDVTNLPPRDRNVSMVFQSYALWPHMKVYDNIAFPLKIRRVPENEVRKKVRWAAELMEIEGLLDRYPHQLSGGQRQRVAVARAIVVEPEVLLMDEPLSNLDAILRVKMRSEIKKLQRRLGVTMIYVTHDQVEAMVIGDRIAVMNDGMIMQVGSPNQIYREPANTFVATFIGSPQMNMMDGYLEGRVLYVANSRLDDVDLGRSGKVIVGFRPERVLIGGFEGLRFKGRIDFVENLGSTTIIHVEVEKGRKIVVSISGEASLSQGEEVTISIPRDAIHVFDAKTGRAIAHGV